MSRTRKNEKRWDSDRSSLSNMKRQLREQEEPRKRGRKVEDEPEEVPDPE